MAIAELRAQIAGQNQSSQIAETRYTSVVPFILNFRRYKEYKGGFGFDWMRDNFKDICNNYSLLEKEYEEADLKYNGMDKRYFIPWLSIPKNYSSELDKEVKLQLEIESDDKWKKSEIEFECPLGITIEPSKLSVKKDMIPPYITIKCSSSHKGGTVTVKTVVSKKEPVSLIVGMMNLVPNEEYPLEIRIVSLIRKSCENEDKQKIADKIDTVSKHITDGFLKQALITPTIVDRKEIIIDDVKWQEDKYTGKRIDNPALSIEKREEMIEKGKSDRFEAEYNNKIVLYKSEPIISAYREQFVELFKGIVIILSDFTHTEGVKGAGIFNPTYRNEVVIYDISEYLDNYTTISHEIGHVLGLEHIFERNLNESQYNNSKNSIIRNESEIARMEANISTCKTNKEDWEAKAEIRRRNRDVRNEQTCRQNAKKYQDAIDNLNDNMKICNQNIAIHQEYVNSYEYLNSLPHFGFRKSSTDNIMDYNTMFGPRLISFFKWQWDRMRHEIKTYHS